MVVVRWFGLEGSSQTLRDGSGCNLFSDLGEARYVATNFALLVPDGGKISVQSAVISV